ncbi:hypothetical protein Nepgr_008044 [Nepenthes gracilis]|uniref:Uncharacterized protein n=1 Tax=Nepenthes gracilis TaxID=150966 RepID=A0AAD3S8D5_NEPGR|nr:hypothetical protein Nepgr_008044 [Nepenthes gracilis]
MQFPETLPVDGDPTGSSEVGFSIEACNVGLDAIKLTIGVHDADTPPGPLATLFDQHISVHVLSYLSSWLENYVGNCGVAATLSCCSAKSYADPDGKLGGDLVGTQSIAGRMQAPCLSRFCIAVIAAASPMLSWLWLMSAEYGSQAWLMWLTELEAGADTGPTDVEAMSYIFFDLYWIGVSSVDSDLFLIKLAGDVSWCVCNLVAVILHLFYVVLSFTAGAEQEFLPRLPTVWLYFNAGLG